MLDARGLDLAQYKESYLRRRLAVRQRALALEDLAAYARCLSHDPGEMDRLVETLTVQVSEFFRNPSLFHLIETLVLPSLIADRQRDGGALRIWSAGCASGEELYSLTILLDRLAPALTGALLLGTDIDAPAIDRARAGQFPRRRLEKLAPELLETYFEDTDDPALARVRTARIPPVRFRVRNLMAAPPMHGADLIACRNVLIYFDMDLQEKVLHLLADALRPGGFLILGRVERLLGGIQGRFQSVDLKERVYRKLPRRGSDAS